MLPKLSQKCSLNVPSGHIVTTSHVFEYIWITLPLASITLQYHFCHHARNIVETFWEHLKCDWSIAGSRMQVKFIDNIPNVLNFYSVITSQELCTKVQHVLSMYLPIPGPLAPSVMSDQGVSSNNKIMSGRIESVDHVEDEEVVDALEGWPPSYILLGV